MTCHVCGYLIPEGKKFCPGCGRVLTAAELQQANSEKSKQEVIETTIVYRPPVSKVSQDTDRMTRITDIFSTDPNAPEYTDPHTYDRATADVLEYDRQFVSRKEDKTVAEDTTTEYSTPAEKRNTYTAAETYPYDNTTEQDYDIEPKYDDDDDNYSKNTVRPRINIKMLIICIAVIAGIVIIITGTYKIGQQFGFWGETETTANTSEEGKTLGEKAPVVKEPESTTSSAVSDYKIGTYTVTSDQSTVFMYRSATDARIIATIPNLEVIKITEISDEMGKTTYGSFTGWVYLEDLEYSPDKELPDGEKTTVAETTTAASENPEDNNDDTGETTTKQESDTAATGTYTVDLQGDGTYLNVRDSGSTDGTAISRIDDGAQVTVDKIENGWGHITTADGVEGWVYMIYLKQQ
ncbi:MAG: SH3 domain-containing protein [Clostridia bacterium]|nr:SH3 domain-containing protein [Clostridia bacterium]